MHQTTSCGSQALLLLLLLLCRQVDAGEQRGQPDAGHGPLGVFPVHRPDCLHVRGSLHICISERMRSACRYCRRLSADGMVGQKWRHGFWPGRAVPQVLACRSDCAAHLPAAAYLQGVLPFCRLAWSAYGLTWAMADDMPAFESPDDQRISV